MRWLEAMTPEELDAYVETDGTFPEPLPDPPLGAVPLDHVDEKTLRERWKQDKRFWERTKEALRKASRSQQ